MLTKSDIQSLLQCPRKLWLERHKSELLPQDSSVLSRRAMDGVIVGDKARAQLGKDFIWPSSQGMNRDASAVEAKKLLLQSPKASAAEVPMVSGGLYARADALIPTGDGYILRETKASSFPLRSDKVTPDAPDEHLLDDVTIQAWVMEGWGVPTARVELSFLNSKWRYPGEGDYSGLFRQLDVTTESGARKAQVPTWLFQAEEILRGSMPEIATGRQCSKPYECLFRSHCEKLDPPAPEHPIELLPGSAGKALAKKLRNKGYTSILDPKPEELTGKQAALFRRIQLAHRTGKAILEDEAAKKIKALPFPRYYFDFEGIDFPVPQWKGVRPYEHIPFQWSCHVERSHGVFEHAEFLDLTGDDPSTGCIERMQEVIAPNDSGPIIVYNSTYERLRLEELSIRHPQYSGVVEKYVSRLVDLRPIVVENFYDPRMKGYFSIKDVLPVVAPDLDYGELQEVQEGTAAQVAYLFVTKDKTITKERKADLEQKLRTYCRQDTWAMVEVAYFLSASARPIRPSGM